MTANSFAIKRLKSIVENVCGYSIDVDNVGCLLDVAVLYNCEMLVRACMFFVLKEYTKVKGSEAWLNMADSTKETVRKQAAMWCAPWTV